MARAIFLTICLVLMSVVAVRADERRVALVVGVADYKHAPRLINTENDARDVAGVLGRLGFEVELVLNPDRLAFEAAVRRLGQRSRGADASLFYYAGHALEVAARNWLLPSSAELKDALDLRFEAFDLDTVVEQTNGGARVSLIFLDACRDNPFRNKLSSGGRSAPSRGLGRIDAGEGTLIAYATAPGVVAQDGKGRNSPFTSALLRFIERPNLEVRQLLSEVRLVFVAEGSGYDLHWDLKWDCLEAFQWEWAPEPRAFAWKRGDYIYIPPFTNHQHVAGDKDECRLIVMSNRITKEMGFDWFDQVERAEGY